jgi:hypothetical protein
MMTAGASVGIMTIGIIGKEVTGGMTGTGIN